MRSSAGRLVEYRFDPGDEAVGRNCPDLTRDLAAAVEHEDGWYRVRVVPDGNSLGLVDVDLHRLQPAGESMGGPFDAGRDHSAGAAPRRPEIQQDRQRGIHDDGVEV